MIKSILVKPLDGLEAGSEREFSQKDFEYLESLGAVRRADAETKAAPPVKNKKAPPVADKASR